MSIKSIVKEYGILFPKFITYIKSQKKNLTKNDIQSLIFNYLKNEESWDKAGHKTSFNQIQKLRFNNIVNDVSRNISLNKSYLELKNNTKFYIRKQDEFHFILVCNIFDYLKKNKHVELLNEFFIETNDNLFVNAWMYFLIIIGIDIVLLLIKFYYKIKINFKKIILENITMILILGIYEYIFFKSIILLYQNISKNELIKLIVGQFDTCLIK